MGWQGLRRMLRTGLDRLEAELNRFSTGASWKRHLKTTQLRELLPDDLDAPPDAQTASILRDALRNYENTSSSGQFRMISRLSGFVTVHGALKELVIPPLERERRQLAASARELDRQLMQLNAGAQWTSHLRLPNEVFFDDATGDHQTLDPLSDPDRIRQELIDALGRFDAVSQNPRYRAIWQLQAFETTHQRLRSYVDLLSQDFGQAPLQGPQLEFVPTPEPEIAPAAEPR
jgi:hypothetical protein